MINPAAAIASLLNTCPGIEPKWQEHLEFWGDEERGFYNDVSVIAHYIVECYGNEGVAFFEQVFSLIERIIRDGDEEAQTLMIIGLIEDIQTIASGRDSGYCVFEQWLGPKSAIAWRQIENMWEGKSSLMDVVREEMALRELE